MFDGFLMVGFLLIGDFGGCLGLVVVCLFCLGISVR